MCNCNRNTLENVRSLAKRFAIDNNTSVAIYETVKGYNFAELQFAIVNNYKIVETYEI
jgi:hypothetical protein